MKLYNIPRETFVVLKEDALVPIGCKPINKGTIIFFDHIDGMYSLCLDETKTNIVHLSASTEVDIL